uniref:CW domain-containing protein n=1 Tax=Caenorhabditis tropicalis TaxID=1561998 RepID=A0A1I7V3Y1_9PELO
MIVTYGKPVNFTLSTPFSAASWDHCVIKCYQLDSCVVAASPGDPIDCQLYNVNNIFLVEKLESSEDLLVAFKVENIQGVCPIGDNPPTFGDGISHVFGGPDVTYTQAQGLAYCQTLNATLTGLETTDERDFIANSGVTMLGPDYPEFAGFWVSGMRKPECYADGWQDISYCTGTNLEQFTFTDNYLTNLAGYTWDYQQPDRNSNGPWANCIQMWIRNEAKFPDEDYTLYPNGASDDAV